MDCIVKPGVKVLLLAIGGGGDIASTAMIARSLLNLGAKYVLASIAWERYIHDPIPGPIKLDEIQECTSRGEHYVVITGNSYAIRGGKKVVFQAAKVARLLGETIYIIDLYGGVEGYVSALKEISSREGVDLVVGVDVGGDSLATGCEENLWSPLADWVGLASLSRVSGVIAIHSPGSDGELTQDYLLEKIDEYARKGGLLAARSMCREDAEFLDEILKYVDSEASRIPLLAYRGVRGAVELRMGSRSVKSTLLSTFTFFLDARLIAEYVEPVKAIYYTKSLEEVRGVLNSYGIYTELDLEEDLFKTGVRPGGLTGEFLMEIRKRGLARVRSGATRSYCVECKGRCT